MKHKGPAPVDENGDPILNSKQRILLKALLEGKSDPEALTLAGYSVNSTALITKVRGIVHKVNARKQQEMQAHTMSKDDGIKILKEIAMSAPHVNSRISALNLLGKWMGYEAATKTENKNENTSVLRIIEDVEELKKETDEGTDSQTPA